MKPIRVFLPLILLLTAPYNAVASTSVDAVLAQFKGVAVTVTDLEQYVSAKNALRPEGAPEGGLSSENVRTVIEQVLRLKMLSQKAKHQNMIDQDTLFAVSVIQPKMLLMEAYINAEAQARVDSIDWDIVMREYYLANRRDFTRPEKIRVRHILLKPNPDWESALLQANRVRERLLAGEEFSALALELSQDTSVQRNAGDLGFFSRGTMFPSFEEAAFELQQGEISDLVVTPFGIHIIELTDRKEPEIVSYEQAKAAALENLKKKRHADEERNILLEILLDDDKDTGVIFNDDALKRFESTLVQK